MHRQIQENLGLATDLLLHAEVGSVSPHAPYVVMRTPQAPDYFSGNMLVLEGRPSHEQRPRLEDDFARLVGSPPTIRHRSFAWHEPTDDRVDLDAYAAHGYRPSVCGVLLGQRSALRASVVNDAVEVRLFDRESRCARRTPPKRH